MTLTQEYNLQEAIQHAIAGTGNGSTRDVIRYLQMYHRKVLDENSLTIEAIGLGNLIRSARKKPPLRDREEKIRSLCLDFGLPFLDLDDEVSIPMDMTNILGSECDWPDIEDSTVDDLDRHLALLDAQEKAHQAKTQAYRTLRQAAANVVPGRTDIPLHELRVIARGRR